MARFISFEGPEGAGKSTQVRLLATALVTRGHSVVCVREPGGTPAGEHIRDLLLNTPEVSISARSEVLLFCAARAQLVDDVLRPALADASIVVADRFSDSTRAYQGSGRGVDSQRLNDVLSFATDGLTPDLTFLLDVPVEAGLHRKQGAAGEWNRLDQESLEYHNTVRNGFLRLARAEPARWRVLDARRLASDLAVEILEIVLGRLEHQGE